MKNKIIKDSVHGYIEIEEKFVALVNSAEFQRLKYIEQGSYRVLYPAARHDRFIHSLGVYHLSKLFGKCFLDNIKNDLGLSSDYTIQEDTFHYASLMHDVGHAPFSHTTEDFFTYASTDNGLSKIEYDFKKAIEDYISSLSIALEDKQARINQFLDDYNDPDCEPKPHEIISATLLIELADKYLNTFKNSLDLELAARMVIGCTYGYSTENDNISDLLGVQNGLIRLLNSETVDVDKLDYIKRDNMMTGFENVSIDINRLANSVTAIKKHGGIYPAFRKISLSVIDNVFRAKEEQGNWIISHPVVLYDSKILSTAITKLWDENTFKLVFSKESLSKTGHDINKQKFALLNDSDILYELKRNSNFEDINSISAQVFDRNIRLKPLWKSKDEFKILFGEKINSIFNFFNGLIAYFDNKDFILNNQTYAILMTDQEHNITEQEKNTATFLKDFFDENDLNFEIAFTKPKASFAPSFNPEHVYIRFDKVLANSEEKFVTYKTLGRDINTNKVNYFYIYTRDTFSSDLLQSFVRETIDKVRERA